MRASSRRARFGFLTGNFEAVPCAYAPQNSCAGQTPQRGAPFGFKALQFRAGGVTGGKGGLGIGKPLLMRLGRGFDLLCRLAAVELFKTCACLFELCVDGGAHFCGFCHFHACRFVGV